MKIGILTYHRSHNYGALLQAIALRRVLVDMGNEVTFIDYWPAYHRHMYTPFSWHTMMERDSLRERCLYAKYCIKNYTYIRKRIECFKAFISTYIEPYVSSTKESYDLIIHGSDQIWRKQPEIKRYNPIYFGHHSIKALKKITYAASMGILPDSDEDKQIVKEYVSSLDKISVRESNLKDLIESLGYSCMLNVDPTLLLTGEEWIDIFNIPHNEEKGYVLYYYLLNNSFDVEQIRLFAKKKGLKLIILYSFGQKTSSDNEISIADPRKFVKLVYGADYVFTSSYHGLVFSLLFHKQVFAAFSKNSDRAASLLSQLGIKDRLLQPMTQIPDVPEINFKEISGILAEIRKKSLIYLNNLNNY